MILFISGKYEKEILRRALCEYIANNDNGHAVKILARVVKCDELQDKQSKKEKAVAPKDNDQSK